MSVYIGNNGSSTFADELYNQFLLCALCSKIYHQPKILTCQHTFCADCIESHYEMDENDRPYRFLLSYNRDISCPVCRTRTPLPTGGVRRLPDNFLVANLADVINRRKPATSASQAVCEICCRNYTGSNTTQSGGRPAAVKCLDCVKVLCKECAELHRKTKVTAAHGMFNIGVEQDVACKVHKNEILRFYCEPCETCICVLCTFHDHKDHDVTSLLDGLQRHRGSFESLLDVCRHRIDVIRGQLQLIDNCEIGLRRAEDHIRDEAIESIAAVRRREKQLLVDLRQAVGEKTFEFMADRKSLEDQLAGLENTFTLTETMMKGTSVELLMLKKEMLGKLNTVLEAGMRPTPEGLRRTVQLLPENCFADVGKPELFGSGKDKSSGGGCGGKTIESVDADVQTDIRETKVANTSTKEDGIQMCKTTNTQTVREDFDKMPVIKAVVSMGSIEHVEMSPAKTVAATQPLCDVMTPLPTTTELAGNRREQRRSSVQGRWPLERSNSGESSSPPITPISTRHIPNFYRPKPAAVFVDASTEMEPIVTSDASTWIPKTITCDKETSTAYIIQVHKNVSTENQTMVDKGTSTFSDVTATYRNVTTSRRTVSVSRGTSTAVRVTSDRATSPVKFVGNPILVTSSAISKIPVSPTITRPVLVTSSASGQISIRTSERPTSSPEGSSTATTTKISSSTTPQKSEAVAALPQNSMTMTTRQVQPPTSLTSSVASWYDDTCHQT